jgi:hypothetical protein
MNVEMHWEKNHPTTSNRCFYRPFSILHIARCEIKAGDGGAIPASGVPAPADVASEPQYGSGELPSVIICRLLQDIWKHIPGNFPNY